MSNDSLGGSKPSARNRGLSLGKMSKPSPLLMCASECQEQQQLEVAIFLPGRGGAHL